MPLKTIFGLLFEWPLKTGFTVPKSHEMTESIDTRTPYVELCLTYSIFLLQVSVKQRSSIS